MTENEIRKFEMKDSKKVSIASLGKWKWPTVIGSMILGIVGYIYIAQPWGPGPNGPWSAADHNRDGIVTRAEMTLFGTQKPHRNSARLLMHFDGADTNHDGIVTQAEIDAYGTEIGSRDPYNHPNER